MLLHENFMESKVLAYASSAFESFLFSNSSINGLHSGVINLSSAPTIAGIFKDVSKYNDNLNIFERLWAVCAKLVFFSE